MTTYDQVHRYTSSWSHSVPIQRTQWDEASCPSGLWTPLRGTDHPRRMLTCLRPCPRPLKRGKETNKLSMWKSYWNQLLASEIRGTSTHRGICQEQWTFRRAWGELGTWYRHCSSSRGEACSYQDPSPSFVRCYPPGSGIRHCEGVPLRSRRPLRRACLFASCSKTAPRHAYLSCTLLSLLCSLCFGPPGAGETLTCRHPAMEIIWSANE